ncbi:MAG: hypothetical protein Q8L49_06150 [Burkholderiaceae bacterium]|nr:hypothetical protein [Burkholderiaceae bacterium]
MGPLDGLWHLLNFVAPAFGVALLAASMVKLLWRRELAAVAWRRLALGSAIAGILALIAGLLVFGRDGKMTTYVALIVANALALWWLGFFRR